MIKEGLALTAVVGAMAVAAVIGQKVDNVGVAVSYPTPTATAHSARPTAQQWLLCTEDDRIVVDLWEKDGLPEAYCEHVEE